MKLYDEIIKSLDDLFLAFAPFTKKFSPEKITSWQSSEKNEMVLPLDMAYELGGSKSQFYALGGTVVTSNKDFVAADEILLIGDDLTEIKNDTSYARLSICRVNDETLGEGNALYKAFKNIEFTRYHVNPKGFMMRVSSLQNRESVRVSKDAIEKGISFGDVGRIMLDLLHRDKNILNAKIVFITLKDFSYDKLENDIKKSLEITKTIEHIASTSLMDCDVCSLQKVCDEVEGMRELHFKKTATKN